MRVAYANAFYSQRSFTGRNVHVKQFIDNASALGHEIWTWPRDQYPGARHLPGGRVERYMKLREMDVIYVRLEDDAPHDLRFATAPYRQICGSPLIVWEFNTAPTQGGTHGSPADELDRVVRDLKRYGAGCDLAVCVSDKLAGFAKDVLGLNRVITVMNGSDPDMFQPGIEPVRHVRRRPDCLNVVWMGSADLRWNNFDLLRQTAEAVCRGGQGTRIQFHIIGKGLVGFGGMPHNVSYHGPEEYERLPHWLAAMDVGLCMYRPGPSDFGSPLKLFDYMASGLAVVSSPQAQVCQIFEALGQSDLIFDADDSAGLAERLVQLAGDRERVRRLGEAGRDLVVTHFNWRRAVSDIFNEIAALPEGRARVNTDAVSLRAPANHRVISANEPQRIGGQQL